MVTTTIKQGIDPSSLKLAWCRHVAKSSAREDICTKYWLLLTTDLMQEPQRHYHNLFHMDLLTKHFNLLEQSLTDKRHPKLDVICECFVQALWFHDAIYDPQSKSNEVESARLFRRFANEIGLDPKKRWIVEQTILDTIQHKQREDFSAQKGDNFAQLPEVDQFETMVDDYKEVSGYFLDADLSILGEASDEVYDEYARRIRMEYSHIEDPVYYVERPKVLLKLIGEVDGADSTVPRTIYLTSYFKELCEDKARVNVRREVEWCKQKLIESTTQ